MPLDHVYDIFEQTRDGGVVWRGVVVGRENAVARVRELGKGSATEYFTMPSSSKEVIARTNFPESS